MVGDFDFVTFPVMTRVSCNEIEMLLSVFFFAFTQQSASKAATCYMAAALSQGNASKTTVSSSYAGLYQIFTSSHALVLIGQGCIPWVTLNAHRTKHRCISDAKHSHIHLS